MEINNCQFIKDLEMRASESSLILREVSKIGHTFFTLLLKTVIEH